MIRIAALAACLLLASTAASASGEPARARANLVSLFSDEDYPLEAVRNREQGAVQFRLGVGADGRPTECAIAATSGSAILDDTTCRLLMERARFEPARDEKGKAVPDEVTARIVWRLPPAEPHGRAEAALSLWSACLFGEAAKLALGNLPPEEIARRAFPLCLPLEAVAGREIDEPAPVEGLRSDMTRAVVDLVTRSRAALNAEPEKP
jgi:TonB family protein